MPVYDDELGFIAWRENMRTAAQAARQSATPELAGNVKSLMRDFPWLQPGTAYGMAKQNITGEKAWKVAAYDLYYQANETDRFGARTKVESPQERLIAWEKELRTQIRSVRKMQQIDEKAGLAFGDSQAATTDQSRINRFGDMDISEIKQMRRTVRAALATNDPVTMNAVLRQVQSASQVKQDPYDLDRQPNPVSRFAQGYKAAFDLQNKIVTGADDRLTGGFVQATVRGAGVAANSGIEALSAVQRGTAGFVADVKEALNLDEYGPQGFKRDTGITSGQTGLTAVAPAQASPYEQDPNGLEGLSPLAILQQTQGGQALIDLVKGNPVDVGSGWLPSPESTTAKAAAEAARDRSPYLIGGHAWTIGRAGADLAQLTPDTTPFTIVSGGVDALNVWFLDPTNFGLEKLADVNRARKVFNLDEAGSVVGRVNAIEDALNAAPAPADWVDAWKINDGGNVRYFDNEEVARKVATNKGLEAPEAVRVPPGHFDPWSETERANQYARTVDGADLPDAPEVSKGRMDGVEYRTSSREIPDLPAAPSREELLANAGVHVGRGPWLRGKNPVDWLYGAGTPIVQALAGESDPWTIFWAFNGRIPIKSETGQNVLELLARATDEGEVRRILAAELGTSMDRVPKWRNGIVAGPGPRLLSDMPGRIIDPDDVNGVAHTLVNYLKLSKASVEDQQRVFNKWVMAEGRGDRYAAIDAAYDAVEAQLRAAKASEEDIADLMRRSRNEWDGASRYGIDADTGQDMPLELFDGEGNLVEVAGPRWDKERWNSTIILPDPQEIRRLVASPAWKWIVKSPVWAGAMALTDGYYDLWKFMVLIRGGWPIRVIGDEMLRMSATGDSPFIHPISYIAQAMGNPNDSRLLNWLEKLGGKPTEEALLEAVQDRSARMTDLIDGGMDAAEARRVVDQEMPLPKNFGKRWSETLRSKMAGVNNTDIAGAPFDPNDAYGEALTSRMIGQSQGQLGRSGVTRNVYLNHFDVVDRTSDTWARGLVGELYRMFSDPTVTRAMRMDTDAFLEGLWSEDWGIAARKQMAAGRSAGDPWLRVLEDRVASDQYGRQILDQLQNFHGGDERLMDALKTGNFTYTDRFGNTEKFPLTYGGHPSDDALDFAKQLQAEGVGPDNLKVQRVWRQQADRTDRDLAALDGFVNGAFDFLMTKPSNYLTRSVTFRGKYWDEAEKLIPAMDRDAQAALRETLRTTKLEKGRAEAILAKLDDTSAGTLTLEQADEILKRRALDHTRNLLYDLHKRNQFFDAARLIFPFGEAWKEVLTTWARIIKENPNALRRAQQIVQGAREAEFDPVTGLPTGQGEGFFRLDPQTGQYVFTYPFSGWLSQQSVTIPFLGKIGPDSPIPIPMKGSAQSLNMVFNGLPGIGPVGQVAASAIVTDSPKWDSVRSTIFPFGEPEGDDPFSQLLNGLKSNWGKKVDQALSDPRQDRLKGNMVFDVMAVLASTGDYKFANDEDATYELTRLFNDAKRTADAMDWIRAAGAFTLPASPAPDFYGKDPTGNLVLLQQMRDEWVAKRDELYKKGVDNASQQAFRWFLQKYGTDNIFATQSKSTLNVVGLEPTKEMRAYERDNADVVTNFPKTWALFAPKGGEFNYDAYVQQIEVGYRDPMDPMEMAQQAINRRAEHKYQKFRKMLPDVPNREQSAWLNDIVKQIRQQFPGSTPGAYGGDEDVVARITELELAAKDPTLSKTELGEALRIYFDARDRANEAALAIPKGKSSSISSSKETQAIRDWLYERADELAAEYDGFAEAWDQVLSREFKD